MKYIKFTDWQELGLKKDVEDIRRTIKSNKSLISTTCVETIVAIISLMLSFFGDDDEKKIIFFNISIIILLAIPIFSGLWFLVNLVKDMYKSSKGMLNVSDKIDSFDNKVCSWTMMSTSYVDILRSCHQSINEEQILFLYQEINYYINKCIEEIYSTLPVVGKVYTCEPNMIINGKHISLSRLYNIISILKRARPYVESDEQTYIRIIISEYGEPDFCSLMLDYSPQYMAIVDFQKKVNEKYNNFLNDFIIIVKDKFDNVSDLFK